ncbi:carboxypeptidase regulatory-like domain-containing protein, partial [bacterium]|nr:carboxypeptidase regulatory-like domain-containing protein [bacterium]
MRTSKGNPSFYFILSILVILCSFCFLQAQSIEDNANVLAGKVIDLSTGIPIASAEITVDLPLWDYCTVSLFGIFNPIVCITDDSGQFKFSNIPIGEFNIIARAPNYYSDSKFAMIEPEKSTDLDFELYYSFSIEHGSISGNITDSQTYEYVSGANIFLLSLSSSDAASYIERTITNTDGSFEFDSVPPGDYKILEVANGYEIQTIYVTVVANQNSLSGGSLIPMIWALTGQVMGIVMDNNMNPVPGAKVRVDGRELKTFTDANGRFIFDKVPAGYVNMVAEKIGVGGGKIGAWVNSGAVTEVRIILLSDNLSFGSIFGTVINYIDGSPYTVKDAKVRIDGKDFVTLTNEKGNFSFEKVPTGIVHIIAEKEGVGSGKADAQVKEDQITEVKIVLSGTGVGTGSIVGIVINAEGNPVAGAKVRIDGKDMTASTNEMGKFTFERVPVGLVLLKAEKEGAGSGKAEVKVIQGQVSEVKIVLSGTSTGYGSIVGIVINAEGNPVAGAKVRIDGKDMTASTNEMGKFAFEKIPVGWVLLIAEKEGA